MADATAAAGEAPQKTSKKGLFLGLILGLLGAGGGFFATSAGLLGGGGSEAAKPAILSGDVAFVPVEEMTISIGPPSARRFLRFRAELEVDKAYQSEVQALMPRVVDVLNTYLRSISLADVEDPAALLTLRSQMRRRIDLVLGEGRVNDLLVMEFVVN